MNAGRPVYQVFEGPSLLAPFRAIAVRFDYRGIFAAPPTPLTASRLAALSGIVPDALIDQVRSSPALENAASLMAGLAVAIQEQPGPLDLRTRVRLAPNGETLVAVEFTSAKGGLLAMKLALDLARHAQGCSELSPRQLTNQVREVLRAQRALQPNQTTRVMLKAARHLDIPHYRLIDSRTLICYGQGEKSLLFSGAASQFDSALGTAIQNSKQDTSRFVSMMGYPVPEQILAVDEQAARAAADRLGYPLAVKPLAEGQGRGVTSDIRNLEAMLADFRRAEAYSPRSVIIERHIPGFDHRITVSRGRVIGAICRMPARVIGDGNTPIAGLIARENKDRDPDLKRQGLLKDIEIDDNLVQTLANDNMTLASIPAHGQVVYLRSNANISTGGTFQDVLERMHSDNLEMAVDIARAMRLDTAGIDFMTRDAAAPWWKEGAIIEVNTTPGVLEDLALDVLKGRFGDGRGARIPTTLVITDDHQGNHSPGEGYVSPDVTSLGGKQRQPEGGTVYRRCLALLVDPACRSMTVSIGRKAIVREGLPLDRFDRCLIDTRSPSGQAILAARARGAPLYQLLEQHAGALEFL